jgi:hypothetical protein
MVLYPKSGRNTSGIFDLGIPPPEVLIPYGEY